VDIHDTDNMLAKGLAAFDNGMYWHQQATSHDSLIAADMRSTDAPSQPGMQETELPCVHQSNESHYFPLDCTSPQSHVGTRKKPLLCVNRHACASAGLKQAGCTWQPSSMQQVVTFATSVSASLESEVTCSTASLVNPGKGQISCAVVSSPSTDKEQADQSREMLHTASSATVLPSLPSLLNLPMEPPEAAAGPLSQRAKAHWRTGQAAVAVASALGPKDHIAVNKAGTDIDRIAGRDPLQYTANLGKSKKKRRRRKKATLQIGSHHKPACAPQSPF
jgi:hypothetical protein